MKILRSPFVHFIRELREGTDTPAGNLLEGCPESTGGGGASVSPVSNLSMLVGNNLQKPFIVGEVPLGLKKYISPQSITLGTKDYEAQLQYFKDNLAFVEAQEKNPSDPDKPKIAYAYLYFTSDPSITEESSTDHFEGWYLVSCEKLSSSYRPFQIPSFKDPNTFVLNESDFKEFIPTSETVLQEQLEIYQVAQKKIGSLQEEIQRLKDDKTTEEKKKTELITALTDRIKRIEQEATTRAKTEKARAEQAKAETKKIIETLSARLIDKDRIQRFKQYVNGLSQISSKVEKIISLHYNYTACKKGLAESEQSISTSRFTELNNLTRDDIERKETVSIRTYKPPPKIMEDMSDQEYEYVIYRIELQEFAEKLKELAEKYLGKCTVNEKGLPKIEIQDYLNRLIKEHSAVCPDIAIRNMNDDNLKNIGENQVEEFALDPRIVGNMNRFLKNVYDVCKASKVLGASDDKIQQREKLAFGVGDGENRENVCTYSLYNAINDPLYNFGLWTNIDSARTKIEIAEENHKAFNQLKLKLQ